VAPLRLLIVGVGGQGVLTVARVLGDAAVRAGLEVVVGQLHGMAQRGGSVEATVLLGRGVHSSFVEQADVVLGFEPLEVLRAVPRITALTRVVINRGRLVPFPLSMAGEPYPDVDGIVRRVREASPRVLEVDGPALLEQLGEPRSLNLLMLGVLAGLDGVLPFDEPLLREVLEQRSPAGRYEVNRRAYELGLATARGAH
jgi:indolepyruvate ferredoxin oxidoreductase beta subunit